MLLPEAPLFTTEGSDRIEFVGAGYTPAPAQNLAPVRRLGDDVRFNRHFEELARGFESVRANTQFQSMLDMS